jgi:hypothetical protein
MNKVHFLSGLLVTSLVLLSGCNQVPDLSFEENDQYEVGRYVWDSQNRRVQIQEQQEFPFSRFLEDWEDGEFNGGGEIAVGFEEHLYVTTPVLEERVINLDPIAFSAAELDFEIGYLGGAAYSEPIDKTFIYDSMESHIYVIHPEKHHVIGDYPLPYRGSFNGDMAYDFTREVIYVLVPGDLPAQDIIGVIDARDGSIVKDIYLDVSEADIQVYEPTSKLFVYDKDGKVLVFDGLNDFELLDEFAVPSQQNFYVDQAGGQFFVGVTPYDIVTYEAQKAALYGEKIVALDHEYGLYLTVEPDGGQTKLYALNKAGDAIFGEFEVPMDFESLVWVYTEKGNFVYFYDGATTVWAYDLW